MELDKIKNSVLAAIGFIFAIFGIWQINVPIDEALLSELVSLVFTILGLIFGAVGGTRVYIATKYDVRAR